MLDYPYVPLARLFLNIDSTDPEDDSGAGMLLATEKERSGFSWEDLFKLDAAIILGSAGSGKTREVLAQAQKLRRGGTCSFVLRLEALCKKHIANSFHPDDLDGRLAYEKWQKTGGAAVVFLDALDEARLPDARNSSALNDALLQLSENIGRLGSRLNIIVTTRGSEWHGSTDFDLVRRTLYGLRSHSLNSDNTPPELKISVFRMRKLEKRDIRALAESRDVDPDSFTTSIDNARAANLATQPLEVHFLLDLWLEETDANKDPQRIFSSRRRIFDEVTRSRLRAEVGQERRSNLDPIQARRACEKLAAASLVSEIPDLTLDHGQQEAIYALDVLATETDPWTEVEVRQLLSYPIFHPSIAGRIRFAHRELKDFLAAHHFDRAIKENAGSTEVISPLFARGFGPDEIPQSTEQVFGWLAAINPLIRQLVIGLRPALLITSGDPTCLSSEEKCRALVSQASLYEDRTNRGEWFSHDDIREFATPELASAVGDLLVSNHSPELREFLVETARFGQMRDLAQQLSLIGSDPTEALRVRSEACFALADFSDNRHLSRILHAALLAIPPQESDTDAAPSWNMYQIAALTYTYPEQATVLDAITILARLRREARNYMSLTPIIFEDFVDRIEDDDRAAWLQLLLRFSSGRRTVDFRRLPAIVPCYTVFAPAICRIVIEAIESDTQMLSQSFFLDALEYLFAVGQDIGMTRRRTPLKVLAEALRQQHDLKSRLIDRRVLLYQQSNYSGAIWAIQQLKFDRGTNAPSIFTFADVKVYCERMKTASNEPDIKLAFDCAQHIAFELSDLEESKKAQKLVRITARNHGTKELRKSNGRIAPLRQFPSRFKHDYRYRIEQQLSRKKRSALNRYWWTKNLWAFVYARSRIRAGDETRYLFWAARKSLDEPGPKVVDAISREYGRWIADSFADGFQNYWKKNSIEYHERNKIGALIGLTGLGLEDQDVLCRYPSELVELAFQYGFCNLGGFPRWLESLAIVHPRIFLAVSMPIFKSDAVSSVDRSGASDGLSKVAYSSAKLRDLIAAPLFQEHGLLDGMTIDDFEIGLNIIATSPSVAADDVSDFLQSGFVKAVVAFDFTKAWVWLRSLFRVDAYSAWSCLVAQIGNDWTHASAGIFRDFIGRETRSFSRVEDADDERDSLSESPAILAELVRATYLVWPPERDPHHEDAYTPSSEDRSTERRGRYLNLLVRQGSGDALSALDRLISDPNLAQYKETFQYQRDLMIRSSARRTQYSAAETIHLLNTYSQPPTSIYEFRQLVKRHIEALLKRLHFSDDDEGYLYRNGRATEDDLRNWLSGRLYDVGNQHYTVIREQEVAIENRPDLRVHARQVALGRISIEIKLADEEHWTGDILIEKVDTQLAQQYMHDDESHTGFYLLANAAKPKKREIDKKTGKTKRKAFAKKVAGATVDFAGLVNAVTIEAEAVTARLGHDKVVEVIAVDLSER